MFDLRHVNGFYLKDSSSLSLFTHQSEVQLPLSIELLDYTDTQRFQVGRNSFLKKDTDKEAKYFIFISNFLFYKTKD